MTLKSSPKTVREKRQAARAAQRRNTYTFIALAVLIVVGVLGAFVYFNRPQPSAPPASGSAELVTGADPAYDVTTTGTGLQLQDIIVGTGETADTGETVAVHYTGWLTDGTKFDSSLDRGSPFTFTVGRGGVIRGWDEGVNGMKVGGKRRLIIPPELGYGSEGAGNIIPPDSTLVFDIELVEIVK